MLVRIVLAACLTACAYGALPPGRPLPDVPISQPGGKKLDLKQYRGRPLVIALISTTCEDCGHAIDFLKVMQTENAARGLQVVAAAGDEIAEKLIGLFVNEHKPNFPLGFLDRPAFIKMANLAKDERPFVPVLLFVDPMGMVRVQLKGDDPLMKKLEVTVGGTIRELLKEPGNKYAKP